jgi:hypothetical protein
MLESSPTIFTYIARACEARRSALGQATSVRHGATESTYQQAVVKILNTCHIQVYDRFNTPIFMASSRSIYLRGTVDGLFNIEEGQALRVSRRRLIWKRKLHSY